MCGVRVIGTVLSMKLLIYSQPPSAGVDSNCKLEQHGSDKFNRAMRGGRYTTTTAGRGKQKQTCSYMRN